MGVCQSSAGGGEGACWDAVADGEPCPTVFELERTIEQERRTAESMRGNLVNIEFRRGLFEVYERGQELNSTALATIHAQDEKRLFTATHKGTGRTYAVREVKLPASRSARELDDVWRVFNAQAVLDHPNLCRVQEIFCSEQRYYVVTDLCSGGDVLSRLRTLGRAGYDEGEAADVLRKVTEALRHCHAEAIVHGNLRVESCLYEDIGPWAEVRLVDAAAVTAAAAANGYGNGNNSGNGSMGRGRLGSDTSKSGSERSRKHRGGWHSPPEVRSGGVSTEAGDMWALGVLAWLVLAGPFPQSGITLEAARSTIMVGKPIFSGEGWASRSRGASDFVSRLLQKDPAKRMTAEEALRHTWLRPRGVAHTLSPALRASLRAFKDSCLIRRLGLRLVGRTLEASQLISARTAFRRVDTQGKGFVTEDDVVKAFAAPEIMLDSSKHIVGASHPGVSASGIGDHQRALDQENEARKVFRSMDEEDSGRVGFSTFLAACLAGKPADEAGARVAFSWLDRGNKGAIVPCDVNLVTGQVVSTQALESAFADGHDVLDEMSLEDAGPAALAVREMEFRKSAASGAPGGFTYAEFYRLLAAVPPRGNASDASTAPTDPC